MISVSTVEQLRYAIERLKATPSDPALSEVLRILDGIVTVFEQIADDH